MDLLLVPYSEPCSIALPVITRWYKGTSRARATKCIASCPTVWYRNESSSSEIKKERGRGVKLESGKPPDLFQVLAREKQQQRVHDHSSDNVRDWSSCPCHHWEERRISSSLINVPSGLILSGYNYNYISQCQEPLTPDLTIISSLAVPLCPKEKNAYYFCWQGRSLVSTWKRILCASHLTRVYHLILSGSNSDWGVRQVMLWIWPWNRRRCAFFCMDRS